MPVEPIRVGDLIIDLDNVAHYERVVRIEHYDPGDLISTYYFAELRPGTRHEKHGLLVTYNVAQEIPTEWELLKKIKAYVSVPVYRMFDYESELLRDHDYRHFSKLSRQYTNLRINEFRRKMPQMPKPDPKATPTVADAMQEQAPYEEPVVQQPAKTIAKPKLSWLQRIKLRIAGMGI